MGTHSESSPPDYDLPLIWNQILMKSKKYMFGFTSAASYSFYITDMISVWADVPTTEEVHKIASSLGITDFDEEKLQILVAGIGEAVREDPTQIDFSYVSSEAMCAKVRLNENLVWSLQPSLCDSKNSASFFRSLCCQAFANHSFMSFRGLQMEGLIRARDEYINYLEENYKTVNGTELMCKYRRQQHGSSDLLKRYSRDDFDASMRSLYPEYLQQSKAQDQHRVWQELNAMAAHQKRWVSLTKRDRESEKVNVPDLLDKNADKKRRLSMSDEKPKRNQRVKLEPCQATESEAPQSPSPSKRVSPSKRKRLGLVGKR